MSEFSAKGNMTDEDFMIHTLNILHKEYNVILNGFENQLTLTDCDAWTIEMIQDKLNHYYEKSRAKRKKTKQKKKT